MLIYNYKLKNIPVYVFEGKLTNLMLCFSFNKNNAYFTCVR